MEKYGLKPKSNLKMTLEQQKNSMIKTLELIDKYFERHGLRYYLVGGTMIGTVRHGGFIPWDDDIDIAVPMPDYEKLKCLVQEEPISEDISVTAYGLNPHHFWPMAKAVDKNTYLVEPNVTKKYQQFQENFGGVYVDIFPIYGLPDDENERKKHCDKIYNLYKSYKRSIRLVKKGSTLKEKIRFILSTASHIPYRIISPEYFLKEMDKAIHQYDFNTSNYCAFALGISKYPKDVNPVYFFGDAKKVKFENLICNAPCRYDEYLSNMYGDYMELPPEDQRRIHPRLVYYRGK